MKRCAFFILFLFLVFMLAGCQSDPNKYNVVGTETDNSGSTDPEETKTEDALMDESLQEIVVGAISIIDDYVNGDMSYAGALEKIKQMSDEVDKLSDEDSSTLLVATNLLLLESEMILQNPDSPLASERVSLLNIRDTFANICGLDERFGTSKKEAYVSNLSEARKNNYDNIIFENFEYGTSEVYIESFRKSKGDPITTTLYLFCSGSRNEMIWGLASGMSAWGATEYDTFALEIFYNGEKIGLIEFYDSNKNAEIKNCAFSDNIIGYASNIEIDPKYKEAFDSIDYSEISNVVELCFKKAVTKLT